MAAGNDNEADLPVVEALEDYQRLSLEVLDRYRGRPEAAVRGLVGLHIDWTTGNPDLARLVAANRHRVMAGSLGPRLREANGQWMDSLRDWLDRERETGGISLGSLAILHAVVFAPTQEIAKLWIAGLLPRDLEEYREPLGDAAWAGISAAGS